MVGEFSVVAPYLRDPLVLIGFFLFLSFLFTRYLIQRKVIPPLPPSLGFRALKIVLLYGFLIGLTLILLGFFFKYRELQLTQQQAAASLQEQRISREAKAAQEAQDRADRLAAEEKRQEDLRREQENTVRLIRTELSGNLQVVNELRKNTETLLTLFTQTATVLRRPGIEVLQVLFSPDNLAAKPAATPGELSEAAFEALVAKGLNTNTLEQQKFNAVAPLVAGTIDRTLPTMESLRDRARTRYVPRSEIWDHNQDILRTLISDVTPFQRSYASLQSLRSNYDIVCDRVIDYATAVRDFMRPPDKKLTREALTKVLATERLAISLSNAYGNEIVRNISTLRTLSKQVGDSPSGLRQPSDPIK